MTNQNPSFNRKTSDKDWQSEQVKDTDAILTSKDAATTLNPNPNFAKPDPTMDDQDWKADRANESLSSEEGWNSDVTGSTVGTENAGDLETNRRNWQSNPSNQNWQSGQNRSSNQSGQNQDVTQQAKQVANDAKEGAKGIASQAKQAAMETVSQAKQAVSDSLDSTKQQMQSTFDSQKSQAANRLGSLATALRQTGDSLQNQNEDKFAQYAQAAADQIEQFSNTLQNKNMNELLSDVQSFARRQPELFIAGSLAAGFLLGRFLKSSSSRSSTGNYGYSNRSNYGRNYGQGYYGSGNVGKHSTADAVTRMDYESPSTPQNIEIARTEGNNAW